MPNLTASTRAPVSRERRIASTEALHAHLAQIAHHNPALNAIITLDL